MFPALSHQLHTSFLFVVLAALREVGVGGGWLNVCAYMW